MTTWKSSWTTRLLLGSVALALFPEMGTVLAQEAGIVSLTSPAHASEPAASCASTPSFLPACSLEQLAHLSYPELEQLYRSAAVGAVPTGYLRGKALYCSSEPFAGARSRVTALLWHGKLFDSCSCTLVNQWCGFRAIRARVYRGTSWLDGGSSIIMDYQGTSRVWANVRDEMRQVGPNLYLGVMYLRRCPEPRFKMFFALEACPTCPCAGSVPGAYDPASATQFELP